MSVIQLLQLDGKNPNIALMRLSAHHKALGDEVRFDRTPNLSAFKRELFDDRVYDARLVYASAIFESSRDLCKRLLQIRPDAIIGGSGWDESMTLERVGVQTEGEYDYTLYPKFRDSIAFSLRGCRLACSFCKVSRMEGRVREATLIGQVWRGDAHPKHLLLMDNDFFGSPLWREKLDYIREGGFKVCINQGINVRLGSGRMRQLTDENAEALATVKYYDDSFKSRRLYMAWDNLKDEKVLFRGLNILKDHGIPPDHMMVYILIGYWPGETRENSWEYRRAKLREFGARPYPMPFTRNKLTVGFQRWVIGAYDKPGSKKHVPWSAWERANYQPQNLGDRFAPSLFDEGEQLDVAA
jgi:hypothetical protein